MGFTCEGVATGSNMTELISVIQRHAIAEHGLTEQQARSPEKIAEWRGAVASSARPKGIRTIRRDA
jgi:predicted small metal-binding protein